MKFGILTIMLITLDGFCTASTLISKRDISDEQYFHLNPLENTYHFGYDINADGTFHHQNRGQDGVTYGCYGYINPNGRLHATHYVSDRRGYRVIEPNTPVSIFLGDESNSNEQIKDSRFKVRPLYALFLPKGCGTHNAVQSGAPKRPEMIYRPPAEPLNATIPVDQPPVLTSIETVHSSTDHTRVPPFFWLFTTSTTSTAVPTTSRSTTQNPRAPCACDES